MSSAGSTDKRKARALRHTGYRPIARNNLKCKFTQINSAPVGASRPGATRRELKVNETKKSPSASERLSCVKVKTVCRYAAPNVSARYILAVRLGLDMIFT